MAKKEKTIDKNEEFDDEYEDGTKQKNKKKKGVLGVVIALIIAVFITFVFFNVAGMRDNYLRPILEKIPIIKNLLPALDEEILSNEEETISIEQQTIDELNNKIDELNAEINRLKTFEEAQLEFKAEKEEFDRLIALNDSKAYSSFYESINPENAEILYQQAVQTIEYDKQFKDYISTFEEMKKDSVAQILEELILTDMDLVITILENLTSTKRSDVLSSMTSKNAASCTKLLSPE